MSQKRIFHYVISNKGAVTQYTGNDTGTLDFMHSILYQIPTLLILTNWKIQSCA